jgi:hypothetical protein
VTSVDGITWTARTSTATSNRYGVSTNINNLVRLDSTSNSLEIVTDSYNQSGYSNIALSIMSNSV